jgi:hypothetical protein
VAHDHIAFVPSADPHIQTATVGSRQRLASLIHAAEP